MRHRVFEFSHDSFVSVAHLHLLTARRFERLPIFRWQCYGGSSAFARIIAPSTDRVVANFEAFLVAATGRLATLERAHVGGISEG